MARRIEQLPETVARGEARVATLGWNTWRHFEAWYGIMGIGAIYHTVNPRLFPEQIAWIVNHAQDRMMLLDLTFVPLMEKLAGAMQSLVHGGASFNSIRALPMPRSARASPMSRMIASVAGHPEYVGVTSTTRPS